MIKTRIVCIVTIVLLSSTLQAIELKSGLYEFDVRYTISGMPSGVPVTKYQQCLSADKPIPTVFLLARSCDVMDMSERHRTLTYRINCFTEHGSLVNEGKMRITPERIEGTSKSDLGDAVGRNSVVRYKFNGRWIGECNQ